MIDLGRVSSEGGPFLIADVDVAVDWRGEYEDGSDYRRVQVLLADRRNDNFPGQLTIGSGTGTIWDAGGAGTARVFANDGSLVLVRPWLHSSRDYAVIPVLASIAMQQKRLLSSLEIKSGKLAILWAAESGEGLRQHGSSSGGPGTELSISSSALLTPIDVGMYDCYEDEVALDDGQIGKRLHILKRARVESAQLTLL